MTTGVGSSSQSASTSTTGNTAGGSQSSGESSTDSTSRTQNTDSTSSSRSGERSRQSAQDVGGSGDVERAAEHIESNPDDRDAVERAMVQSGHLSEVNQLAQRLDGVSGKSTLGFSPSATGLSFQQNDATVQLVDAEAGQSPSDAGGETPTASATTRPAGAATEPLASASPPTALQFPGGATLSAGQWAGVSVVSVNNPEAGKSVHAIAVGGFSLVNENTADGSKTTFTHTNPDGEASSWSLDVAEGQVTTESQRADGSGSKHEYVERGGSLHTYTEAPGWVTASTSVERIGADGNRAVKDSTTYGVGILNVDSTSVTEFDTEGNVTADTSKGSVNAGVPYVAAVSLGAQVGSNWGLSVKAELLPVGATAQQISPNASVERFAGLNLGGQVGRDGFSVAAEGDLAYKAAGLNGEVTALRDPMTNATTVEVGIGAQILKSNTGFGVTGGTLTDGAGNSVGGFAEGGASLLGWGITGGAQNTEDAGQQGRVGVTGLFGIEGGLSFDAVDGTGIYGDFNGLGNKPDLTEVPPAQP
jgi:hypothetical protein